MGFIKKIMVPILLASAALGAATFYVVNQPPFGGTPGDERLSRMQQSPNYQDGKFRNQLATPVMAADASYLKLLKLQLSGGKNRSPKDSLPVIKRRLADPVSPDSIYFSWFGHSYLFLQLEGYNLLIDPVFSERASPFQFIGSKGYPGTAVYGVEDMPAIDYVLITHDHYDHLDYPTIQQLASKVKAFYVPLGVGAHLERWGVPPAHIHELDWWDELPLGHVMLASTPARHFSGRGITDRNKTLWTSYVLKSRNYSLYVGGDSGYGPHFKEIGEKYGPFDLTMLESGQYHPYWPYIHMMPEETVQAHLDLKGRWLLPIHWGKFTLSLHAWNEPIERVLAKAKEEGVEVLTPKIGEQIVLEGEQPKERWW